MINLDDNPEPEEKTLRDEFAMAALAGILANPDYLLHLSNTQESIGEKSYWFADGMLEAREATK